MNFSDLGLSEKLLRAVNDAGYSEPTPIQAQAIPIVLMGRDVLGCAQTGTGKTASFTLPMIEILESGRAKARMPRSLILEPTRELAAQVADNFDTYGKYHKLTKALLIGGSSMAEQLKVLDKGVDVLIATPGRLLDVFERGHLLMNDVRTLVIDEADRMLDMGFIPDVEKIVSLLSPMRTTLLFSATMPKEIKALADKFLSNPKEITVSRPEQTAETITQALIMVEHKDGKRPGGGQKEKRNILRQLILKDDPRNAIIFCNRKRDVDVVCKSLVKHGFIADRLHGDMDQSSRMETLTKFKAGGFKFMVCSDVAARGLDIPAMSHVFNFDVPTHPEDYVHRIGRTGRAGNKGYAYTIATKEDRKYLTGIEQITGRKIPEVTLDKKASAPKPTVHIDVSASEATNAAQNEIVTSDATKNPRRRRSKQSTNVRKPTANIVQFEEKKAPIEAQVKTSVKAPTEPITDKLKRNLKKTHQHTVKGLGSHMPAFLMAVPTPKKRPIAQIETGLNEEKDVEIRVESKNISLESFDDATSIKAEVEE
jgi:superfamily II DNA/RNA helicase